MNTYEQTIGASAAFSGSGKTRFSVAIPVAMTRRSDEANKVSRFWDLAEPHEQKLYNYIKKCLAFSPDGDDVFQETLLRGMRYFQSYRDSRCFKTWLFAIAHNEIRRSFGHSRRWDASEAVARLTAKDESVNRVLVHEVYRMAESLKPKHREVFFLFYDSGFSVAEVARITGFRQGNVKFILNRARATLRKSLGGSHE
jgi:RNA polymerase sigma-70 factor (ECF subfamily)